MTSTVKSSANRFRFRAWHKKLRKMVLLDEMSICEEYGTLSFGASDGEYAGIGNLPGSYNLDNEGRHDPSVDCENMDNWIIMQSTGLTDKNGKEIFEGDIFEADTLEEYRSDGYKRTFRMLGKVSWEDYEDSGWLFEGYLKGQSHNDSQNYRNGRPHEFLTGFSQEDIISDTLEVIGNIYENPDLLPSS